jgi:hypothetical protein
VSSALELAEAHLVRRIREAVKTLHPPGILPAEHAVLQLYKPGAVHEAMAIVEAIHKLVPRA